MEIRQLCENEVQMAVQTAHEVFESYMRPYIRSPKEPEQFYGYVQAERLWREVHEGRLILWGAFDGGRMCGVAAMQKVCHITMLYVRPQYIGKKVGTRLLYAMCGYARDVIHQERVTINVMPVVAAPYFYHKGFGMIQNVALTDVYVPLEGRASAILPKSPEIVYKPRKVKAGFVAALTAGVLVFCTVVMAGVTISHMVSDGLLTDYDYEMMLEDGETV